jgi:hypothetical protein
MSMLVSFSQQGGLEEAISKTFDGKHPCKLCKLVSEGKKAEHKQAELNVLKKEQLACFFVILPFFTPALPLPHTVFEQTAIVRHDPPLKLPPAMA